MTLCTFSKEYVASSFTNVENIFITAYMPEADGNAVKVYLYGLFLCKSHEDYTVDNICDSLSLDLNAVVDAFKFWEEFGLVDIVSEEPLSVVYLPILLQGSKPRKISVEKYTEFNRSLQNIISGRMITTNEYAEYFRFMETFNIKQQAMLMIAQYCVNLKGLSIGGKYISAVTKDFALRGVTTPEKVEKELENYTTRSQEIAKILSALQSKRTPEVEDVRYLQKWLGELGFEYDSILYAAEKLKKASMSKLDEFLLELYNNKKFSKEEIELWSKNKKLLFDLTVDINKQLSVYYEVIDTVCDNYTSKWLTLGYRRETLLLLANYCFRRGRNNYEYMDELITKLYKQGLVSMESIVEYFKALAADDDFIKSILDTVGLTRKPNDWDRRNVSNWRLWGFTDEVILLAAEKSQGKNSPLTYINAILSSLKANGAFGIEEAKIKLNEQPSSQTQKQKTVHFAGEREYSPETLNKLIDDVDDIEI